MAVSEIFTPSYINAGKYKFVSSRIPHSYLCYWSRKNTSDIPFWTYYVQTRASACSDLQRMPKQLPVTQVSNETGLRVGLTQKTGLLVNAPFRISCDVQFLCMECVARTTSARLQVISYASICSTNYRRLPVFHMSLLLLPLAST